MRLLTYFITSICLLFFSINIYAEKSVEMSLRDAIILSLRYNQQVQDAELQRVVDKYALRVALWAFEPKYSLTGAASYTNGVSSGNKSESDSTNFVGPSMSVLTPLGTTFTVQPTTPLVHSSGKPRFYNPAVQFSIKQPLLKDSGTDIVLLGLHQAEYAELTARLNFKNAIIQNVTNVISQYVALASAQNNVINIELSVKNAEATLKQQEGYLKAGRIAPSDLIQHQTSVATQTLSLEQSKVSAEQAKRTLLITLGVDPNTPIRATKEIKFENDTLPSLQECIRLALKNNMSYQTALIGLENAKLNLLSAQNQQRWQLDLQVSRTQGGGSGSNPNSGLPSLTNGSNYNTTVGLTLNVPIDNLSLKQNLEGAKIALKKAHIDLAAQKRTIENTVINNYTAVINQKQQIHQAQVAVQLAQQSLNIADIKLKFGKVTAFEVSTLQNSLVTTQLSYITTVTTYYTNLATLDQTLGTTLDRWNVTLKY